MQGTVVRTQLVGASLPRARNLVGQVVHGGTQREGLQADPRIRSFQRGFKLALRTVAVVGFKG